MSVAEWTRDWAEQKGLEVHYFESVDSTNDFAKEIEFKDPVVVVCDHQTKGRGRYDRTWTDSKGLDLLSSWCFCVEKPIQPVLTPALGWALWKAAFQTWPHPGLSVKSPNDFLWNGKKLGGILVETIQTDATRVVIGVGINVQETPAIDNAACLAEMLDHLVKKSEWSSFLSFFWARLETALACGLSGKLLPSVAVELCEALNKNSSLHEPVKEVRPDGSLVLESRVIPWSEL